MEGTYTFSGFTPESILITGEDGKQITAIEGEERAAYDAIKGFNPQKRVDTYLTYIHNRNINSLENEEFTGFGSLFTGCQATHFIADFFIEQANITYDNRHFRNSEGVSLTKKVLSHLIGSTISGIFETLYNTIGLVKNVALTIFDATLGMLWEFVKGISDVTVGTNYADFGDRFHSIKEHFKASITNINEIARNVIRTIPVIGHSAGGLFDKVETMVIDGLETAGRQVMSLYNTITCASSKPKKERSLVV